MQAPAVPTLLAIEHISHCYFFSLVYNKYGHLHGYELIDIVHGEKGAWWNAYVKGNNTIIEHKEIAKEFQSVA